jgi:hypothetical protein
MGRIASPISRRALICTLICTLIAGGWPAQPAAAAERIPSHCIALARDTPRGLERIIPASLGAPLGQDHIRIRFIDHATYALETPSGLLALTDYSWPVADLPRVPDVVTMNNAHRTHWTPTPDPRIPHVLHGWADDGGAAYHDLDLGEMLVRNVPTDARDRMGGIRKDGNSIFIFEAAGLCIGHLGHLHHQPDVFQYASIGRLDVVMVPVDGGLTMAAAEMAQVVKRLRSSVVLPMHWFSGASLEVFLNEMSQEFEIERHDGAEIELSLHGLPSRPTIMVLQASGRAP